MRLIERKDDGDDVRRGQVTLLRGSAIDALNEYPGGTATEKVLAMHEQLRGAVERTNAALRIIEDHRDSRGNVQMGRGFSSQVIELLRAAGGQ